MEKNLKRIYSYICVYVHIYMCVCLSVCVYVCLNRFSVYLKSHNIANQLYFNKKIKFGNKYSYRNQNKDFTPT